MAARSPARPSGPKKQASPGHELPINEKMLPLTHESNVFPLEDDVRQSDRTIRS